MCACVCIVVYCEISIQNIWLLQGIAVPVVTQVNLMRLSWLEWMAKQKCTRWSCLLTGCLCCHLLVVSGMVLKEDGIKYVYLKLLLEKICTRTHTCAHTRMTQHPHTLQTHYKTHANTNTLQNAHTQKQLHFLAYTDRRCPGTSSSKPEPTASVSRKGMIITSFHLLQLLQ